jgi:N6-adenosine-specific RNA methylase IME4
MSDQRNWPFGDLPLFGHDVLYVDPPWPFENYSTKGESRNPNRHYETMSIDQIKALPVGHLAAGNCALFMWCVDPHLDSAIDVIRAWGFRFVTVAFTWVKRSKKDTGWHMGTGYYTRANPEICVMATNGRPGTPADRGVRQLIIEPVREHSRKPERVYDDIERMYPGKRYLELFARKEHPGWKAWGNQTTKFTNDGEHYP